MNLASATTGNGANSANSKKRKFCAIRPAYKTMPVTHPDYVQDGVFATYEKAKPAVTGKSNALYRCFKENDFPDPKRAAELWSYELDPDSTQGGDGRLEYSPDLQSHAKGQTATVPENCIGAAAAAANKTVVGAVEAEVARHVEGEILMDNEQTDASKKQKVSLDVVPTVDPLQQLKPGASLNNILTAVNASSAKTDSLELMLELVGTDVTGLSFNLVKTADGVQCSRKASCCFEQQVHIAPKLRN
jgi:hypothetical protein